MTKEKQPLWMSGNEALALGAYEAGVQVASGYPGTPSTEIMENLSKYEGVYTEWAPNEKVGLEVAIGASFAGARTLATMKHVGVNVAADPLFTAAYTGVRGGLVLVSADDPEMHSSQNEQDNRNYALAAKVPMLEPSEPQEVKEFMRIAYELSEELDTPVMMRMTTRVSHVKGVVAPDERIEGPVERKIEKVPSKLVMLPAMARMRRGFVEERMNKCLEIAEKAPYNKIERGDNTKGFITAGVSYLYVKEAFPDASVLKLGMCWPLPENLIREFAASVDTLYVVEELDPFLETQLKAMGIECIGKEVIPNQGELNTDIVRRAIDPTATKELFDAPELPNRPPNMCAGCPHRGIFFNLSRMKVFVSGDIGCYTLGFLPPLSAMDACVCMGASVSMAHGMQKALDGAHNKIVSVIGDSTFVHTGLNGLINTVYNNSASTLIILDNRITAMTGQQPNPASGTNIKGEAANSLDFVALCKAVGVKHVFEVNPHDVVATRQVLKDAIELEEMSVVISKAPCVLLPEMKQKKKIPLFTVKENCVGCTSCIRLGCPAISWTAFKDADEAEARGYKRKQKGFSAINEDHCLGCGQCASLCKFNAITKREE